MSILILGLLIFLGTHSIGMVALPWRNHMVERLGLWPWKGLYALVSLAGLVLIVWGYGEARLDPVWLWHSPVWTRHLASVLVLVASVLILAAYIPGNRIKARVGHPMVLGVKVWALAHLFANGSLADLVLFGTLLAWSVVAFAVFRRRDRARGTVPITASGPWRDLTTLSTGVAAWAVFAFVLHEPLIGVAPLG